MNNFERITSAEIPVLVDFFAEWCGPCKVMAPELQKLSGLVGDKMRIIKVDVDKNPQVAQKYGIQGVPTLILFKAGQIKWQQSGAQSAQSLFNTLKPFI